MPMNLPNKDDIDRLKKERNWMFDQLSKINSVKVWPSEANFFLIRLIEKSGSLVFAQLKSKGFLVKNLKSLLTTLFLLLFLL